MIQAGALSSNAESGHLVIVEYPPSEMDRLVAFYDDHFAGQEGLNRLASDGADGRTLSYTNEELVLSVSDDGSMASLFIQTRSDG